jgi:hypothetical protein
MVGVSRDGPLVSVKPATGVSVSEGKTVFQDRFATAAANNVKTNINAATKTLIQN